MATKVNNGRLTKIIYLLHPQNPLLNTRNSEISRTLRQNITHFAQISFPLQRESVGGKCDWQHSVAHPRKPPIAQKSHRYLLHRPSYSQFCPKIRCHGNVRWQGKNLNDTIG